MVSLLRGAGLFVDHMEKSCSSQFSGEEGGLTVRMLGTAGSLGRSTTNSRMSAMRSVIPAPRRPRQEDQSSLGYIVRLSQW